MANFIPSKKTAQDFNNGVEYINGVDETTGDAVNAEDINNLVESALYSQIIAERAFQYADNAKENSDYAKALATNPIDNSEANNVGEAAFEITLMPDGTPRLKAKNLKGETGKQGGKGDKGEQGSNLYSFSLNGGNLYVTSAIAEESKIKLVNGYIIFGD